MTTLYSSINTRQNQKEWRLCGISSVCRRVVIRVRDIIRIAAVLNSGWVAGEVIVHVNILGGPVHVQDDDVLDIHLCDEKVSGPKPHGGVAREERVFGKLLLLAAFFHGHPLSGEECARAPGVLGVVVHLVAVV